MSNVNVPGWAALMDRAPRGKGNSGIQAPSSVWLHRFLEPGNSLGTWSPLLDSPHSKAQRTKGECGQLHRRFRRQAQHLCPRPCLHLDVRGNVGQPSAQGRKGIDLMAIQPVHAAGQQESQEDSTWALVRQCPMDGL